MTAIAGWIAEHARATPDQHALLFAGQVITYAQLHRRIEQLHAHHQDRLAEVMEACTLQPCSAADILPVMFKRPLDLHQTTFAMGEAVAHLHTLWFEGKLQRERGADGIYRFSAA